MGEGSAAGVPWGDGRETGDVGRLEEGMAGSFSFRTGVAHQVENEVRVLSYVGPCFPGTLHMSQNPLPR